MVKLTECLLAEKVASFVHNIFDFRRNTPKRDTNARFAVACEEETDKVKNKSRG